MGNQQERAFNFMSLSGQDVDLIMTALGELPSKNTRAIMNRLEQQIYEQLQPQMPPAPENIPA